MAKDENTLYHAIQPATITVGQTINISALTAMSETYLDVLISTCPN